MNQSSVHMSFAAIRANFRKWGEKFRSKGEDKQDPKPDGRHLTFEQHDEISESLQATTTGPVSLSASASDQEAVSYEGEIANVLEETGFDVEIDNPRKESAETKLPTGLEMTIKENTVRPIHAYWILSAFRRAGIAIVTRINGKQPKNDTLYISVGANDTAAPVPPTGETDAPGDQKSGPVCAKSGN